VNEQQQAERITRRAAGPSLRDRLRSAAAAHSIPLKVEIELTKRCNLRCVHCYAATAVAQPEVETRRWLQVVDELAELGCLGVVLTGGEITLRSDFLEVARRVRERRMALSVLTNGTPVSDEQLDELARLKAGVGVSIYGATAATHDLVTGVPGSFDRAVRTLEGLRLRGIRRVLHTVLMTENIDEFSDIVQLAETLDCRYLFDPSVVPRADGSDDVLVHRVGGDRLREFYAHSALFNKTREGRIAREPGEPEGRVPGACAAGITAAFIEANGDVLPCMGFPPAFGNIVTGTFGEAWSGPIAQEHRRMMNQPLAVCGQCALLGYCTTHCPRLAYLETQDMTRPNSRACELAQMVRELRSELSGSGTVC
jgi:radical SAM protein with 4Fe4S-binding SPASM domain